MIKKVYSISRIGRRQYQEDRQCDFTIPVGNTDVHVYCVFDGHGGDMVSSALARCIQEYVAKSFDEKSSEEMTFVERVELALRSALSSIDRDLAELVESASIADDQGSTANICAFYRDIDGELCVTCANVGDSRSIVLGAASIHALSTDHSLDRKDECDRIYESGGFVFRRPHTGQLLLCGCVAMSRSFGNKSLPGITAEPDVSTRRIEPGMTHAVIATDGLWNSMTNDQVASFFSEGDKTDAMEALYALVRRANSSDNITVYVVAFE